MTTIPAALPLSVIKRDIYRWMMLLPGKKNLNQRVFNSFIFKKQNSKMKSLIFILALVSIAGCYRFFFTLSFVIDNLHDLNRRAERASVWASLAATFSRMSLVSECVCRFAIAERRQGRRNGNERRPIDGAADGRTALRTRQHHEPQSHSPNAQGRPSW